MHLFRSTAYLGMCLAFVSAMPGVPLIPGGSREPEHAGVLRSSTFFGCETGFTFEVSGESARCRRAASVVVAPLAECPQAGGVALAERIDLVGTKDMCASTTPGTDVSVERNCPPNYTKRVLSGLDRCEMPAPEMIRAPSIPVAR